MVKTCWSPIDGGMTLHWLLWENKSCFDRKHWVNSRHDIIPRVLGVWSDNSCFDHSTCGKCGGLTYLAGLAKFYLGWFTAFLLNGFSVGLGCICINIYIYTFIKIIDVLLVVCMIAAVYCQETKTQKNKRPKTTKTKHKNSETPSVLYV